MTIQNWVINQINKENSPIQYSNKNMQEERLSLNTENKRV